MFLLRKKAVYSRSEKQAFHRNGHSLLRGLVQMNPFWRPSVQQASPLSSSKLRYLDKYNRAKGLQQQLVLLVVGEGARGPQGCPHGGPHPTTLLLRLGNKVGLEQVELDQSVAEQQGESQHPPGSIENIRTTWGKLKDRRNLELGTQRAIKGNAIDEDEPSFL